MNPNPYGDPILIPQIIIDIADTYFDESFLNKDVPTKNDFYRRFSGGMFTALVTPKYYRYSGNLAREKGYEVGLKYLQENPEKINEIISAYGWQPIEIDGTWVCSFEVSDFLPDKAITADRESPWWLENMSDFKPYHTKFNDRTKKWEGMHVHVRGFLSQEGEFGHLGMYSHMFYATSVEHISEPG